MSGAIVRRALCCLGLLALALTAPADSQAEVAAAGTLQVSFSGKLNPRALPRHGRAPISVRIGGEISTTDQTDPPPLRTVAIAINRRGHLDPAARPACRLDQIQPGTTAAAVRACPGAKVGEGAFSAAVAVPGQAPFPSVGTVTAFNGREHGRPVVLLHIYGIDPVPTSLTLPLRMGRGRGDFGTVLSGSLPSVSNNIGFVTGLSLKLGGGGGPRPYLSAGCPAPTGFPSAIFPLTRASFAFEGGKVLSSTLVRSCRAIG